MTQTPMTGSTTNARRRRASLPPYLWIVNPLRTSLFWIGFMLVQAASFLYEVVLIAIPCALSGRYRRQYHHRRWNTVISFWGRNACKMARWATGLTIDVKGLVPEGRHLIVANHQSAMDILVLHEVLLTKNLKFVVKKSLLRWLWVVSYALRDGGYGPVDFDDPRQTMRDLRRFARSLQAWDGSPVIFPEGIRSFDGSMAEFRSAGVRLLLRETGLPVLPVVIDGLWKARSVGAFFLHLPGARCRVSVLPPMDVSPGGEVAAPVARLERTMRAELERMRRECPGPGGRP